MLVAFGTGLYGWKIEFEEAKPVVWIGVILYVFALYFIMLVTNLIYRYIVLSAAQTLYAYFVESNTVFVGKRKTFDKRVGFIASPGLSRLIVLFLDCHRTDNNFITNYSLLDKHFWQSCFPMPLLLHRCLLSPFNFQRQISPSQRQNNKDAAF